MGFHSQPLFLSQLQRFKRSLSLKTILRSKSVENFFLRSGSELKCPTEVLLTPPTPLPPSSPPRASTDRGLPTLAPSPCPVPRPLASLKPVRLHSFQEHVFKRANPCELCHQFIVGRCLRRARGWARVGMGIGLWNFLRVTAPSANGAPHPGQTDEHCWGGGCPVLLCLLTTQASVPVHALTGRGVDASPGDCPLPSPHPLTCLLCSIAHGCVLS